MIRVALPEPVVLSRPYRIIYRISSPGVGYSNAGSMVDFNTNQTYLQNDLHLGYPVVISGRTCETCYGGWHIWVIDGFHLDTFYNLDCSGSSPVCQESAFLFYSMKWGRHNNYSADGWYGVGGFSENGDVYGHGS